MADYGARYADRKISVVDRELKATYKTAQRELKKKLADFNKRFEEESRKKKQQVKDGEITEQEYKDWLIGRVFVRNQWESNIRQVNKVLLEHNKQAARIVRESKFDVFAENYNYNAFQTEKAFNVSFSLYNAESVARLILDNPQILPEWKIDEKKDYRWNYQKVNNIVKQGIIQGEGVAEITDRLCRDLSTMNENKMRTFARTAITGAQNAGRQQQMNDAADMGIEQLKGWLATHDSKTRDAHRHLDGEEVQYDKPFKSDLGDIMYPGDPTADPANVYNCRCTIVTIYPKYEDRSQPDWRESETIDGQSYQEWKKGKKTRGEVQPGTDGEEPASELEKKIQKRIDGAPHELTKAEHRAIEDYVSGDMMFINQILRGRAGELTDDDREFVKLMDSALNDTLGKEQTLYRSVDAEAIFGKISDGVYQNLVTYLLYGKDSFGKGSYADGIRSKVEGIIKRTDGAEITEKGYMSTTKDKELAGDWGGFTGSEKPIVIELKTPSDVKGRDLKEFEVEGDEQQEVLLARGQKYRIIGVRGENGNVVVYAEIITGGKK